MSHTTTFAITAFLAASTFAGVSQASNTEMNWPRDIDATLRTFRGNFDIVAVVSLDGSEALPVVEPKPYADALQAAIRANTHLSSELRSKNVEISSIVGAKQAMDGSVTLYTD